jgi:hypothetical protein
MWSMNRQLLRFAKNLREAKYVEVSQWPLCRRCLHWRKVNLVLAKLLCCGGFLAVFIGFVVAAFDDGQNPALAIPLCAGFAAILASTPVFRVAGLSHVTRSEVTAKGTVVRLSEVSSEFAAQLPRHYCSVTS